jgi:hypothetical protein
MVTAYLDLENCLTVAQKSEVAVAILYMTYVIQIYAAIFWSSAAHLLLADVSLIIYREHGIFLRV